MNTCKATLRVLFAHRVYLMIYLVFIGILMMSISWAMLTSASGSMSAVFCLAHPIPQPRHSSRPKCVSPSSIETRTGAASRHRCAHTCRIPANW